MSYDLPDLETFVYSDQTFGATAVVHNIKGAVGKVGFVRDISVDIMTSLLGLTTVPEIMVGISSGDATYGRYRLGTTTAGGTNVGYGTGFFRASQEATVIGNPPRNSQQFTNKVVLDGYPLTNSGIAGGTYLTVYPAGRIPKDTNAVVTCQAGTGGTAAGGGVVRVTVQWLGDNVP